MTTTTEKISVLLLINQSLFRRGVEQALNSNDSIVVSSVNDISSVPCSTHRHGPSVAIIDIDLPLKGGYVTARQLKLRLPDTGIIALTASFDDLQLLQVLKAQASACLRKDASEAQLLDTVYKVARGQHPIKEYLINRPLLADQVFRQFQQLSNEMDMRITTTNLTNREIEILKWVDEGLMNRQIAEELSISEQTVKNHITSILRKTGVKSRHEAVTMARKQGLLSVIERAN